MAKKDIKNDKVLAVKKRLRYFCFISKCKTMNYLKLFLATSEYCSKNNNTLKNTNKAINQCVQKKLVLALRPLNLPSLFFNEKNKNINLT